MLRAIWQNILRGVVFFSPGFPNEMLAKFNYPGCGKSDKPQFVYKTGWWTDFKLKQNAIEMRNYIRLYPILIGNMVPEDDEVGELLISFTKIVEMTSSRLFGEILILTDMIEEFFVDYLQTISEAKSLFFNTLS